MAGIDLQLPLDQPRDEGRLLSRLRKQFEDEHFERARLIVAFAKVGPLRRMKEEISLWKQSSRDIDAIFGIDHDNTSFDALQFALENFNEVRLVHQRSNSVTFHPKIYLFEEQDRAYAYIGSNNLTVGGTESNLEAGVALEMDLTSEDDFALYKSLDQSWQETKAASSVLTDAMLQQLAREGKVSLEREMWASSTTDSEQDSNESDEVSFPEVENEPISSPSATPSGEGSPSRASGDGASPMQDSSPYSGIAVSALVMEVRQRENGEIHLSYTAAKENESFFEFPFSGETTPKKDSNEAYPQRDPKPLVDVRLYDENGVMQVEKKNFKLTMVDYEKRSEIRVTMPRAVVGYATGYDGPDYTIISIERMPSSTPLDYTVTLYLPGSEEYENRLEECDNDMPSGGKPNPRSYGWL